MKKLKKLLPVMIALFVFGNINAYAQATGELRSFIMKIEIVALDFDHKVTASMTVWQDVANDRSASEMTYTVEAGDFTDSSRMLTIEDGMWAYVINLDNNMGHRVPRSEIEDDDILDVDVIEDEAYFRQMIAEEGGQVVGYERFLNRNCLVVEFPQDDFDVDGSAAKVWYYKGLALKIESEFMTLTTTHFEENPNIPADRFRVPAGVMME